MDRRIVYPAQIPLVEDQLMQTRFTQKALGYLAQTLVGESGTGATGFDWSLAGGMTVSVGPGQIIALGEADSTSYGVLGGDNSPLLVQYIFPAAGTLEIPGVGQTYIVYGTLSVQDQHDLVLPFYNSANPSQTYAGPDNNGASSATVRASLVTIGIANSVPSGSVPLWQIVVPSGATSLTSEMISAAPGAPFYPSLAATAPRTLAPFNASLAADFGGYPLNAIVADATTEGLYWRSTAAGNTTVPGADGASWTNFTGDFLSKTQTAEQDVAGFVKFTGSKGETLQIVNAPPDVPATSVGYNVPNTAWIDEYYATKTALASTTEIANEGVTNAATAQSAAESAQSTANEGVTNAAAAQSSADAAQTTASTGVTNAATAQTAAEAAQATANAAVSGGATSGSVKRGEVLYLADNGYPSFVYDGGTVQLALLGQLVDDGSFRLESGEVGSVTQGTRITFSTAFGSAPVVVFNSINNSDINCHPYSIDSGGFYYHGNAGASSDINYIAYGPK